MFDSGDALLHLGADIGERQSEGEVDVAHQGPADNPHFLTLADKRNSSLIFTRFQRDYRSSDFTRIVALNNNNCSL